jgi:hypothetical protein
MDCDVARALIARLGLIDVVTFAVTWAKIAC